MTSDPFDISEYSSVDVEFYFRPVSMENGEDFWLRYNDGSGWVTVGTWVVGSGGISNNNFYTSTVTLNAGTYNLSSSAQFRFQCDASVNNDRVYIDLVTISGNCSGLPVIGDPVIVTKELKTPISGLGLDEYSSIMEDDVKMFPNPATTQLNLEFPEGMIVNNLKIFSLNGGIFRNADATDDLERVDISNLTPGIYFLSIQTEDEVITKKFIKQ